MVTIFSVWHACNAWAQDPGAAEVGEGDPEVGAALVAAREAELGLVVVDNGDGTWSYAGPSDPPPDQMIGSLTLRYDGQERFADAPIPNEGDVTWVEPDYVLTGVEHDAWSYLDFRMVDTRGQRWVVSDIDLGSIDPLAPESPSAGDTGGSPGIEWNPNAGVPHLLTLTSPNFTGIVCDGTTAFVQNIQNGGMVTAPLDATERSAVMVRTWTGSRFVECSGVLVRDDAVLTAAHCVTDNNGNSFGGASHTNVCTLENLDANATDGKWPECYDLDTFFVPTAWSGSNPYQLTQDFAILFLDRGTGLGAMPMTNLSDVEVYVSGDHHLGYPKWNPNCTPNSVLDNCARTDNRHPGRELYAATGSVDAMLTPYARWNTTFGAGTSGGPHYCDDGWCTSPQLTGIQTSHEITCTPGTPPSCDQLHGVGPKASAFRNAVEALLWNTSPPAPCPFHGLEEADFSSHRPGLPTEFPPSFSPTCQTRVPLPPGFGTSICDPIQVYEPPAPLPCTAQDKLVVYLPGTAWGPEHNDFPMEYAAYAGFRTIGLSYANAWDTSTWCTGRKELMDQVDLNNPDNSSTVVCHDESSGDSVIDHTDECPFWLRRERITGVDDPRSNYDPSWATYMTPEQQEEFDYLHGYSLGKVGNPNGPPAGFPVEDSVLYRLLRTLVLLDTKDTANQCEWNRFYNNLDGNLQFTVSGDDDVEILGFAGQMSAINWDQIIVAGWSQGAGHAVWINLMQEVGGLFMLEGPSDMCLMDATDDGSGRGASYYGALVDPVLEPSGAAPRFGVFHVDSNFTGGASDARPVAWDNYTFPDHDDPLRGLRMPVCEDEAWDGNVAKAEPSAGLGDSAGIPGLKRSPFPCIGCPANVSVEAFTSMGLRTRQVVVGSLPPVLGDRSGPCGPHASVALSHRLYPAENCMPTGPRPGGVQQATTPEAAHLFEAYVQGFCALGEQ